MWQDISWTRTVLVECSVQQAPMQTLPLGYVRVAHQTVRPAWTPVTTASAARKAAINFFSNRGGAGLNAQSKLLYTLSSRMKNNLCNDGVSLFTVFPPLCFIKCLLPLLSAVSLRQQRGRVKPAIAPAWHVMAPSPSVCPVLRATTWRVVCVDSTVHCVHTLEMMVPADAVLPIVTFAQTTGPVSVS